MTWKENLLKKKDLLKNKWIRFIPGIQKLITPGSPYQSKIKTPPLPPTDMPKLAVNRPQINNETGLTRTETALLSPSEQEIARKT